MHACIRQMIKIRCLSFLSRSRTPQYLICVIFQEQRNLLNVEHQFSHIPPEMSSFLIECRFFIRLLAACAKLGCDPNSYAEVLDEIADELEIARAYAFFFFNI